MPRSAIRFERTRLPRRLFRTGRPAAAFQTDDPQKGLSEISESPFLFPLWDRFLPEVGPPRSRSPRDRSQPELFPPRSRVRPWASAVLRGIPARPGTLPILCGTSTCPGAFARSPRYFCLPEHLGRSAAVFLPVRMPRGLSGEEFRPVAACLPLSLVAGPSLVVTPFWTSRPSPPLRLDAAPEPGRQLWCELKSPMVLIRSSKVSRETIVWFLIFER